MVVVELRDDVAGAVVEAFERPESDDEQAALRHSETQSASQTGRRCTTTPYRRRLRCCFNGRRTVREAGALG